MTVPDQLNQWIIWMTANRPKLLRYGRGLQILTGVFLLLLGWHMGHEHLRLIRSGVRTQGKIVDSKMEIFTTRAGSGSTTSHNAHMPIVEFQVGDRTVRFKDWLGSRSSPTLNQVVSVIYARDEPAIAMIDRPVMNWIPWAPILAVGLFLVVVGTNGLSRSCLKEVKNGAMR
jgi:hypothetical protein